MGCGTVVPEADKVCSGYYVEAGELRVLLDCGPGVLHHLARFGIPWPQLTHVVLSHFHNDHIGDLPALLSSMRFRSGGKREPLGLLGPVGTNELLRNLARAFGEYVLDPGFPLVVQELRTGELTSLGDAQLWAHEARHSAPALGYRLHAASGQVLAYTGDTGESEALAQFLRGADLLVAECSLPDDQPQNGHLTPSRVASLAAIAEPRELLLTHVFPQLAAQDLTALVRAAGWRGPVRVAADGLRVTV